MTVWHTRLHRVVFMVITFIIVCSVSLCSACAVMPQSTPTQSVYGAVDIITPDGSNSLDPSVPLNSWSHMRSEIISSLQQAHFDSSSINSQVAHSLEDEIARISDVIHRNYLAPHDQKRVLIVAPMQAIETPQSQAITQQYGDIVTQPNFSPDNLEKSQIDEQQKNNYLSLLSQLSAELNLTQQTGITVVLLAQKVRDFQEDYFVSFANARSIAHIQADNLVKKLELDKATVRSARSIEILLPANAGAEFNREAFSAAWDILKPYFASGVAFSPSGLLNANTDNKDWAQVTIPNDSTEAVSQALHKRLAYKNNSYKDVDGILAFNDHVANNVVNVLNSMGFKGSSVEINSNITLDAIVSTLSGNTDVRKQRVPRPDLSKINTDGESDTDSQTNSTLLDSLTQKLPENFQHIFDNKLSWPLITGYGISIDTIPNIVDGKIWISSMSQRHETAHAIAHLAQQVCTHRSPIEIDRDIVMLHRSTLFSPLFAVTADNLKKTMIDTHYINLADAGL